MGYENVILMFNELEKIVKNPDVNRQWKMMLSNVYGVYLILDTTNGQQYVGSAYGKDGIWGRWSDYVHTKHGGNKILIELLTNDPMRYKKFQFSILNVLPHGFNRYFPANDNFSKISQKPIDVFPRTDTIKNSP